MSTTASKKKKEPDNEQRVLATLLDTGKYTDLKLVCGEMELKVHRAVVCTQSDFFDKACSSDFKEATEGVIKLGEVDPETVQRLVSYFYNGDYLVDESDDSVNVLLAHIRMYEIAVRYEVRNLRTLIMKKFPGALATVKGSEAVPNAFIIESLKELFVTIPEDEGQPLRDAFISSSVGHSIISNVSTTTEFRELCDAHGSIGLAVYLAKSKGLNHDFNMANLPAINQNLHMKDVLTLLNSQDNSNGNLIRQWFCSCPSHMNAGNFVGNNSNQYIYFHAGSRKYYACCNSSGNTYTF